MVSETKHVAFDEEKLVEIIEDDRDKYETRETHATGRKAFLIFTSFCLGVLLAGYGGGFTTTLPLIRTNELSPSL